MSNPVVFKFTCTACEQKVEQGAPPEQMYLEYNYGGETRVAGHQACSKCFRAMLPHVLQQEAYDAELEKKKPPKQFNIDKMRGGVPDSVLDRLQDKAEEYNAVSEAIQEYREDPTQYRPEILVSKGPGPLEDPPEVYDLKPGPQQTDTLALILAEMINTQNRMIETQERTNQLLVEMKQAPAQPKPQNNNWRKNQQNARYRNNNNRPGR